MVVILFPPESSTTGHIMHMEDQGRNGSSMYPTIYPGMTLKVENYNGVPLCGHIYVYERNGTRYAHRLVYQNSDGELYFKGDNLQRLDDVVRPGEIKYHITAVEYE